MILLILPTQLFSKQLLRKELKKNVVSKVIIWEHPQYFSKYKYNKKKLLLHRASMKYYCDYLQKGGKYTVEYLEHGSSVVKIPKSYLVFDPVDKIKLPGAPTYLENPNFLLTKEDYAVYREKSKAFRFHNFFAFGKKVLGKLEKVGSTDKDNRKRMPKNVEIPKVPTNKNDAKWIKEAGDYVDRCFPKNYGNVDDFMYPVTHTTAKKWLKAFIQDRFGNFGNYQDFIRKDDGFLFHSFLSSSLNIGLLTVGEVVAAIFKAKVAINNLEGFYRQLFWREYQRYTYIYFKFDGLNYFGNKKRLSKAWYNGTLGIEPVDVAIKRGFSTGYLHHIERLMVVGNFMNLSGISPKQGFKWFMEFSCDSYEWVMKQNVLDMVFCVSNGKTMRKPYVSSSNYVLKMSDYKKGDWSETWNRLYQEFLVRNQDKLQKYRYHFPGLKKI